MNIHEIIINETCKFYGVEPDWLKGKSRKQKPIRIRQFVYSMLRNRGMMTLKSIGVIMGGRDHSTIVNALQELENLHDTEQILHYKYKRDYEIVMYFVDRNIKINFMNTYYCEFCNSASFYNCTCDKKMAKIF